MQAGCQIEYILYIQVIIIGKKTGPTEYSHNCHKTLQILWNKIPIMQPTLPARVGQLKKHCVYNRITSSLTEMGSGIVKIVAVKIYDTPFQNCFIACNSHKALH